MRVVQKYGGSSLPTVQQIKKIAKHIKSQLATTPQIVVVVSAMGKTTNSLIALSKEITPHPNQRELDALLHTGEVQTISLLSASLQSIGVKAISLTGWQAGIYTDSTYGRAFIRSIDISRIEKHLKQGYVVVVAGFQGIASNMDITTLGRGGSDTTAVALASKLNCPCEIYTDVRCVHTINPQLYPKAKPLHKISYEEMMEMSLSGTKVLETRCVELAKKYNVSLYLGKSLSKDKSSGSFIMAKDYFEKMPITNLSVKEDVVCISTVFKEEQNYAPQIFEIIRASTINLEMLSVAKLKKQKIFSFLAPKDEAQNIVKKLKTLKNIKVEIFSDFVKMTVIGSGLSTHTGIAETLFHHLHAQNITVDKIVITEISISFTIQKKDKEKAVKNIAELFQL